jgi:hypothetical protein
LIYLSLLAKMFNIDNERGTIDENECHTI